MPPPRRLLSVVALLLLAGATVNIAVAWTIAARAKPAHVWGGSDPRPPGWFVPPRWPEGVSWRKCRREVAPVFGFGHAIFRLDTGDATRPEIHAETIAFGWPLRSMRCGSVRQEGRERTFGRRLAVPDYFKRRRAAFEATEGAVPHAIWPVGFAANSVLYAGLLALPLTFFPLRRRIRRARGRCSACGYDLTGLKPGPCPECGEAA